MLAQGFVVLGRKVTNLTLEVDETAAVAAVGGVDDDDVGVLAGVATVAATLVVVESGSLGKRFITKLTLVRLVSGVNPTVSLQGGRLPERFTAHLTAKRTNAIMAPDVSDKRGLVPESVVADRT